MARTVTRSPFAPAAGGPARRLARRAVIAGTALAALALAPAGATAASSVAITAPPIEGALPTKAKTVKVAVQNVTKRKLSGLSVNVRAIKGVRVVVVGARKGTTTRRLSALKAGRTARVSVRLQRLKGGPKKGRVTVRVQRKKRTVGSQRLQFGVPPKNLDTLAGRYFWGSTFTLNGIDQKTLYFATDGLVYTDDMEGAWATCPAEDEKCRPYRYTAKGNQLQVDGKPAELDGRKLKHDGQTYFEFGPPPAKTRWAGRLTYANSSGLCPLYCTYSTEHLQFNADGTFVRSSVTSGTSPVLDFAVVPPENKGTYEVGADKLLHMAFADGKMRVETIGVYLDDAGKPKSPMEGMILDGDGYFDISKD